MSGGTVMQSDELYLEGLSKALAKDGRAGQALRLRKIAEWMREDKARHAAELAAVRVRADEAEQERDEASLEVERFRARCEAQRVRADAAEADRGAWQARAARAEHAFDQADLQARRSAELAKLRKSRIDTVTHYYLAMSVDRDRLRGVLQQVRDIRFARRCNGIDMGEFFTRLDAALTEGADV